jgi:hypothetical protein
MKSLFKFVEATNKEIRIWAWLGAVVPISSLAGLFFVWALGTESLLNTVMIVGATAMFTVAVVWWWWALHVFRTLIYHWSHTKDSVEEVSREVKEIKNIFKDIFFKSRDK